MQITIFMLKHKSNKRKQSEQKNHLASMHDAALFHNRIINLWNALPDNIVIAKSVSCFQTYLLDYAYYDGNYFFTCHYY